jgi:hypothetical protein
VFGSKKQLDKLKKSDYKIELVGVDSIEEVINIVIG